MNDVNAKEVERLIAKAKLYVRMLSAETSGYESAGGWVSPAGQCQFIAGRMSHFAEMFVDLACEIFAAEVAE